MNKTNWKPYAVGIAIPLAIGGLSAFLTREGMEVYNQAAVQPPLSPPSFLFPIVWGILYVLMGISSTRIWQNPPSRERSLGLNLYTTQLVLNFFWSLIFFNAHAYGFALLWLGILWAVVIGMILAFRKVDKIAAWLQIPYLLWLTFAAYLNYGVWTLNK